ncbi:MAG: hypothetical protein WCG80_10180 [Spirochaetales bacterium]
MGQIDNTAAGTGSSHGTPTDYRIPPSDRVILRALATRVAELASRPEEDRKRKLWTAHNDLKSTEPVVFCDPENGWGEILPSEALICENELARVWEHGLRKEIFWALEMKDDRVIEPWFTVGYHYADSGWGYDLKKIGGEHGGSYVWEIPIQDWETDFERLKFPEITIDEVNTQRTLNLAEEVFSGILPVRLKGQWWWTLGLTWDFINLRGLENFMFDLYDNPDWVHKTLSLLSQGTLRKLDFLESRGLLPLNTEGTYVGSGGFGWTEQLPAPGFDPQQVRTRDMWGFCESQETVGVSAEMFEEFVLPYQLPILERFGLNCYGCCEPLDVRWEAVKKVPRLRRVSTSPWADRPRMAGLLGKDYILSLKPSPAPLAVPHLDEALVRQTIRDDLVATRGCVVEYIMKDNNTLGGNPRNATRWVELVREEMARL